MSCNLPQYRKYLLQKTNQHERVYNSSNNSVLYSLSDHPLVFVWVIKVASHDLSFFHSPPGGQLTIHLSEFLKDWGLWPFRLTFIAKIIPTVCDTLIFIRTGLSRTTCAVTNDEASQSKDTKGRHSCVFWMFAGVLRSFCSEFFYIFTKGVIRRMLLCVVPGNYSCQCLATAEKWQMGVVFQDLCHCCSLGVPEWIHYTIYYYTTIFSYISSGWSSPDIILL